MLWSSERKLWGRAILQWVSWLYSSDMSWILLVEDWGCTICLMRRLNGLIQILIFHKLINSVKLLHQIFKSLFVSSYCAIQSPILKCNNLLEILRKVWILQQIWPGFVFNDSLLLFLQPNVFSFTYIFTIVYKGIKASTRMQPICWMMHWASERRHWALIIPPWVIFTGRTLHEAGNCCVWYCCMLRPLLGNAG